MSFVNHVQVAKLKQDVFKRGENIMRTEFWNELNQELEKLDPDTTAHLTNLGTIPSF